LVVDLTAGQLLDTFTRDRFGPETTVGGSNLLARIQAMPPEFRGLFSEYQDVANPFGGILVYKHGVEYALDTSSHPGMAKLQGLDPEKFGPPKQKSFKWRKKELSTNLAAVR
jgi:hypothetical protein